MPTELAGSAGVCPLCGEALETARRLIFFHELAGGIAEVAPTEEADATSALPAHRFGHFELAGLVGRGGAGKVYEACNLETGLTVALKLLEFRPLETSAAGIRRLRREGRVATTIAHRNVVAVFDLGIIDGVCYIEMELVEGMSLREHVRRRGLLPADEARDLCGQMLTGLACLHEARIVHRDVKPGNVLLDASGRARLTDFGLSRFMEETTSESGSAKLLGSPHFMAPEQWRGEGVSERTDVDGAGLVLYDTLTGQLPCEGEQPVARMYRHLNEPVLADDESHPSSPDDPADVIRRATRKAPEERFAGANEFAAALEGAAR